MRSDPKHTIQTIPHSDQPTTFNCIWQKRFPLTVTVFSLNVTHFPVAITSIHAHMVFQMFG